MLIRARIVLPISQPPIENGAVLISGRRISAVGRWMDLAAQHSGESIDLGATVLLPGLVNAHCHLDYTDMAGKITPPKSFTDWIKSMVALKGSWNYTDFAQSWVNGAKMLLRTGTTTVADIEAVPELIPDMWQATPLRVISFRELIALKHRSNISEFINPAVEQWAAMPGSQNRIGLSPHATYTTSAELLQLAAEKARERKWRLTTHVAESEQEFEMFMYRHGALYDWLKSQRNMSDCGHGSPVRHLDQLGYLDENLLAVHVNYLGRDDALVLGNRQVSVAHCPRSHAYFRHLEFPRAELAAAGVNICLGTDSLASSVKARHQPPLELNLFAEMQTLAHYSPDVPPAAILKMATVNGAQGLGLQGEIGELAPHALADLIAIPFSEKAASVYEAAVHHAGDVSASMINGAWAIKPALA